MTVERWKELMGRADATRCSDSLAAARCILTYQTYAGRDHDLANALVAYAQLLHDHGVTP